MSWKWNGAYPLAAHPDAWEHQQPRKSGWPTVREAQVEDGRAFVVIEAVGKSFYWFVMDLKGLATPGAEDGENWVQVTLGGNIPPRLRNTEHFQKDLPFIGGDYVGEKFPNYNDLEYDIFGFYMIPFLTRVLTMDPLDGAE